MLFSRDDSLYDSELLTRNALVTGRCGLNLQRTHRSCPRAPERSSIPAGEGPSLGCGAPGRFDEPCRGAHSSPTEKLARALGASENLESHRPDQGRRSSRTA